MFQKEVKVKILKDSINLLVSQKQQSGGGFGQALTSELDDVLANYHKLCDRLKSKCHTLEVTSVRMGKKSPIISHKLHSFKNVYSGKKKKFCKRPG